MWQDVRYALRMLLKSRGFTAIAIITLALGIAGTTAIFTVVDEVLLHPLSYPESDRIMKVAESERSTGDSTDVFSPANYVDFVSRNEVFSFLAASRPWSGNLTGIDHPERLKGTMVTSSFFPLFGIQPILGRTLNPEDEKAGSDHVLVLSYGLWQRLFGADRTVIGRSMNLNGEPYTVLGVMPAGFSPDQYGELWLPSRWGVPTHAILADDDPRLFRDRHFLDVWGRLKPGVTLQQAMGRADAVARSLEKQYPDSNPDLGISIIPLHEYFVGDVRAPLLLLFAAVGSVLLIGCANVANLLLGRAATRAKEISIRTALGAGRLRIVRQLLTESVILSLLGGLLGVLLAVWAISALRSLSPSGIHVFTNIGINREVLGFTFLVSLLSGVFFGLAPAYHASRPNPNESLKEGERGTTGRGSRTRSALVIAEVGLSLILLIAAGLLVKSFVQLTNVDPGFETRRILVFNLALPPNVSAERQAAFYGDVIQRLKVLPGVQSAGAVSRLPLSGGNSTRSFTVPGSDRTDYEADIRVSTPDYFRAMSIPLLQGRYLEERDLAGTAPVIVVNQAFAEKIFPGQNPIGKKITDFVPDAAFEIVGVVGNVRHMGLGTQPRPEVYQPLGQAKWFSMEVVIRTASSEPASLIMGAQNAVWSVDKNVPLANVRTMQQVLASSVLRQRFTMSLLTIFAGMALFLAAIGLYGVMSYSVTVRTQEIGIRMALGAQSRDVLRLIVRHGMVLAFAGVGIGIVASLSLTRLISSLLYGVSATDPLTFISIALLLIAIAFLANYIPARRAAALNPINALHYE